MLRLTPGLRMVFGLASSLALGACDRAPRDLSPWSRTLPGTDGESLVALALDPQGETAITGLQINPGDFAPTAIPPVGGNGLFLAMLSDTGGSLWGATNHAPALSGHGVALAANGDVILLGSFTGQVDLAGHTLSSDDGAMFLARFDPRGKLLWSKTFGGTSTGSAIGLSLAASASGEAVIGGYIHGAADLGGGVIRGDTSTSFVASFDENGNHRWSRALRGGYHQVNAVAIDATGAVLAAGSGYGGLAFDTPDGGQDFTPSAFIARLSPAGEPGFITALSAIASSGVPTITSLALDPAGDIVCGGSFYGTVTFGAETFYSDGGDPFVARLSSAGAPLWLDHFGGSNGSAVAVAVAADARIYATGYYQGDHLDVGGLRLGTTTQAAVFLAEIGPGGAVSDARIFGNREQLSVGRALVIDPQGALVIGGWFKGTVDFDDQRLTSDPAGSSFVARLSLPFASHQRE